MVISFTLSLIRYDDFEWSLKFLRLIHHLRPDLLPKMMVVVPRPEILRSDAPTLQNMLIRVEDESLARFLSSAGAKLSARLLENTSHRRRARIHTRMEYWQQRLTEGDLVDRRKVVYYLSYLFLYEQVKKYLD